MNQNRYLEIRNSLDLRADPHALVRYGLETLGLFGALFYLGVEYRDSALRFLAIPLVSLIMLRSFAFMHEAVHGLLSKKRALNQFLGVLSGTLCLLSYESWKQAHLEHHRWAGNIDKDPVAAMIKTFPKFPKPLQRILTLGWKCWLPALSILQHTVFWGLHLKHSVTRRHSAGQLASSFFPLAFWIAVFALLPLGATLSILVPGLFLYLIGTEVINAPHHLGLTYVHGETKLPVWEQFRIARTCAYPAWLARFVVLNFNFHTEHHMYPYVPWYHLDRLHGAIRDELKERYNLDPSFSWVLTNRPKDLGAVFGSDQAGDHDSAKAA